MKTANYFCKKIIILLLMLRLFSVTFNFLVNFFVIFGMQKQLKNQMGYARLNLSYVHTHGNEIVSILLLD